jgi:hypothetical protein
MKVVGCSNQGSPGPAALPKNLACGASETFSLSARWSTNQKPTLCRVASYSWPGITEADDQAGWFMATKNEMAAGGMMPAAAIAAGCRKLLGGSFAFSGSFGRAAVLANDADDDRVIGRAGPA